MINATHMKKTKIILSILIMFIAVGCISFTHNAKATELEWTTQPTGVGTSYSSIAYGNGMYVAIRGGGMYSAYYTSPDGATWTQRNFPLSHDWQTVVYGNGTFVVLSQDSGYVLTSADGTNWTHSATLTDYYWYSLGYGNGMFVAIEAFMSKVAVSTDGVNWTQYSSTIAGNYWDEMAYGNGTFVAVDYQTHTVTTSTNGINWTSHTVSAASGGLGSIAYGDGVFVVVDNNNAIYMSSDDGATWVEPSLPVTYTWGAVSYGGNQFVALARNAGVYIVSSDGINWDDYTMTQNATGYAIVYGDDQFVAVALSGFVMTSEEIVSLGVSGNQNISATIQETMTLSCGADIDLDNSTTLIPETPQSNTTTCTVTTNDAEGYNLSVVDDRGASNTLYHETLSASPDGQIQDKTPWDPTGSGNAQAWTGDGMGFGILSSEATKNSTWWGTGNTCDDTNQLYAGFPNTDQNILEHTSYTNTATDTEICYRVNVPSTQIAGEYTGSVTYTATGRP